jgi:hypothetical protein
MCNQKVFDDSILPKFSPEGIPLRDPRDPDDPDYNEPMGNKETENFTFDAERGIGQVFKEIFC